MEYHQRKRRTVAFAAALTLLCGTLVGLGLWRANADKDDLAVQAKQTYHARIRRGLDGAIRFASPSDSAEGVRAAVAAVDGTIRARANFGMSDGTRERLAKLEEDALKGGASRRVNAQELTDAITDVVVNRMASMSDGEIEYAARGFRRTEGLVELRASGVNSATPDEFKAMARSLREQGRAGQRAARDTVRQFIEHEVVGRFADFSEAAPGHFGSARDKGVTPLQAVVVTYSVLADDRFEGSAEDLGKDAPEFAKRTGKKAYGVNGYRFSTPLNLVLNQEATAALLDRLEKGGGR